MSARRAATPPKRRPRYPCLRRQEPVDCPPTRQKRPRQWPSGQPTRLCAAASLNNSSFVSGYCFSDTAKFSEFTALLGLDTATHWTLYYTDRPYEGFCHCSGG